MLRCPRILCQLKFRRPPQLTLAHQTIPSVPLNVDANVSRRHFRSRVDASVTSLSAPRLLETLSALSEKDASEKPVEGIAKMKERISGLQAYRHLRLLDRSSLSALPSSAYFALIVRATKQRLLESLALLVQDIAELVPESSERTGALMKILQSPTLALLPPKTILVVLECIQRASSTWLDKLTPGDVAVLARTFADASPSALETDLALVKIICSLLLSRLRNLPQPTGDAVLSYKPPDIIHASFAFVEKLLQLSQEQAALEMFQILVNSGNIPAEAVQPIPGLEDFTSIVRSSLVRASTHWQWRPWAERFLSPLLKSSPKSPSSLSSASITLTVDTAYGCLDDPTIDDLRACRSLISQLHPFAPMPNGLIRQFYSAAEQIDAGEEASELYAFTRTEEVLSAHRYPPPRGASLPWLLLYLSRTNSHYAKELGEEVFKGSLPVAVESRARIVERLASQGHATLARNLWSQYAIGKDRETFLRDPSLMVRMVSLFNHRVKQDDDTFAKGAAKKDAELVRERANDMRSFLKFVLSEFARANSPMAEASHQVLTSQARAFFIVGEFTRALDTLKILFARREMPDLYDVNVTLTIMAEHDPRAAAQIVQRMISRGLQPDHITYGTIMHHALNHGDMELVEEMVQRVRMLKNTHLSYKSIVSLVRGSVAYREGDSQFAQRSKMRSVLSIVRTIGKQTVVGNSHLGKYLVYAALRGDDPVMAYKFWEVLLKDNAAWGDGEQVSLRRRLLRSIVRHQKAGWVKELQARLMVSQLRARDGNFLENNIIQNNA